MKPDEPITPQQLLDSMGDAVSTPEDPVIFTACPKCGTVIATSTHVTLIHRDDGQHWVDYQGHYDPHR